ncbi:AAA family ATPase [Caminibacter mediatlanticus]|uniref:ATP-dependent Zn protease n=1 Tax=Caminibacter mediatlanticus TB-2 TaxID=391592 RepID=A0AAI9AIN4_9BACT|nr:AAA family ATPase [Caminibacter mediatlanticus]EDM24209.1 ATP-dependent Zn protease [Caminibacter mediatlanticus TB-2]
MSKNNKNLLITIAVIVILFALLITAGIKSGNLNSSVLISQIIGVFIVLIFFVFLIALIKNFFPKTQQPQQVQVEMNTGIEKDFVIKPITSNYTFKDVAGINEVKEELIEIVDFLKNPQKYRDFGINLPKGVLLVGPPGVGKTLIAKALAGEAGVPFFYQSGSSFVQMYVGVGAKRVRDLFSKAKAMAPSIIFIDEIDAIGKARGNLRNDEREATLNQLLTEMDGFEGSEGVIVIGATNKVELLDEALLRPGRFDRRIFVELPGLKDRLEILKVHMKNKPFKGNLENIAKMTVGFSGAALASLVNEASIYALKQGKHFIEESDFYAVKDKVLMGKKRLNTYSPKEKEILSYYQASKAVIADWLGVEFERISLVKDDFKEEDKEIISKTEIMSKIETLLAGRVGVEERFNEKYSNAHKDIKKARELAYKMIKDYGMGENITGDESEVAKILDEAYKETKELYVSHKLLIEKVYEKMLKDEVIHKEDIEKIKNEIF